MAKGVIYILTNPSFPEYVKIGYASNLERRMNELNNSSAVPFAFRVYAVYETDRELSDKEVHKIIDGLNPDLRAIENFDGKKRTKEFYAMSAEDAYRIFESIGKISGTESRLKKMKPTGHEVLDEKTAKEVEQNNKEKAKSFSFYACGIKDGDEIYFTRDEKVKAKVVSDYKVEYNGETMTLTGLARKLLNKDKSQGVPGPDFFSFKGEKINDIRRRLGLINF